MQSHHRVLGIIAFAAVAAATPSALHAISARRCARKCTFTTGRCVVDRGAQCHDAVPAAPCYQALDQQCQREAVAACVESGGKSCKRRPCNLYRELWCECQALTPPDAELPALCDLPRRCRPIPRCTTTTTSTTLPPPTARYCCVNLCAGGGRCVLHGECSAPVGVTCCPGDDHAEIIQVGSCAAVFSTCGPSCQ